VRGCGVGEGCGGWVGGEELKAGADVVAEGGGGDAAEVGAWGSSLRRAAVSRRVAPRGCAGEVVHGTVTWMRPWRKVFSGCGR